MSVVPPVPAATVLLLRDAPEGMEVFMVKRHHQIDFVAGALVFPGGKVSPDDEAASVKAAAYRQAGWTQLLGAAATAAIREAFEEAGILLARDATGAIVSKSRLAALDRHRESIEKGTMRLQDFLLAARLSLAYDELVHFARWITPKHMPRRFDTHFFLARAPHGHVGRHDGRESVDSVWIRPRDAIADRARWNVIFPTKLNLMKLANFSDVAQAIAAARATPPMTVEPWIEETPEGKILRIRGDAGYAQTSALLHEAL